MAAAVGGTAAGGSLVLAAIMFKSNLALFMGILVPLLALLLGGYLLYVRMKRRKRTQLFNQGLQSNAAATPRGISDPNKIQKLDELRRRFDEGVKAFRSRNKDLTSLPWYVIVGEPGGGKTEAIRHSNIGFPPGLQDELQGIGGTINMNWWFSDNAVLLDTAGRMIFEESPAGESTEWKEFLNLLKASRPNCPINGILLVIPCDSLVKDSEAEIERKARKLAEQLDTIQRVLDVRFPVSVLVTKADLLVGFREYFDDIRDPKLQHQILGWSNPEKLDSPFKPSEVDRYLEELGGRLSRRRLAMLRDPAPETPGARRADEVDTLYALPGSISAIAPRLRRYLELLFKQGTWSLPPLFLRGIYFSSALREGAALDADLASALGVPMESISDFKMWERERSFFLKDLFLEKIFREGGLVTRATDTKKMLRRRKLWLYGGATAAIAFFLGIAWMGMRSFEMSIKSQSAAWRPVAESGWTNGVFGRSLIPVLPNGSYQTTVEKHEFDARQAQLGLFHDTLKTESMKPVKLDWLSRIFFGHLATRYQNESLNAQRIVFETGVVKPLVEAARRKAASHVATNLEGTVQHAEALAALLNLEGDIITRWTGTNTGRPTPANIQRLADPLLNFLVGETLDTNLLQTWSWLYSSNRTTLAAAGRGVWPPDWLSDHVEKAPQDLRGYPAIQEGLAVLYRGITNGLSEQVGHWATVRELHGLVKNVHAAEQGMFVASRGGNFPEADGARQRFITAAGTLESWMTRNRGAPVFSGGTISLVRAHRDLTQGGAHPSGGPLPIIQAACSNNLARQEHKLFTDVQELLGRFQRQLTEESARLAGAIPQKELTDLDALYLNVLPDQRFSFIARRDTLRQLQAAFELPIPAEQIGTEGRFLEELNTAVSRLGALASEQTGLPGDFRQAVAWFLERAREQRTGAFFMSYLQEALAKLAPAANFPIGTNKSQLLGAAQVGELRLLAQRIRGDLTAPDFQKALPPSAEWRDFSNRSQSILDRASALVNENGLPVRVKVTILPYDGNNPMDDWRKTWEFTQTFDKSTSLRIGDRDIAEKELGTHRIDEPLELVFTARQELQPASQPIVRKTRPWGVLELIQSPDAEPDLNTPGAWTIAWPLNQPPTEGALRLRVEWLGAHPLPRPGTAPRRAL
jgi:hypothetical protein